MKLKKNMSIKQNLQKLESIGLISKKPKPIFVFLLAYAYFMLWIFTFLFYYKYEMTALKYPMIGITTITLLTLAFAIIHTLIVKILGKNSSKKSLPKDAKV